MSDSLATPGTAAHQAPLSLGFARQEQLKGLPFPSAGDPSKQGSSLGLLHYRQILYHWDTRKDLDVHGEIWKHAGAWIYFQIFSSENLGHPWWRAAIHGVAKSRTRLSDWTGLNWTGGSSWWRIHLQWRRPRLDLVATHPIILAWEIPWTEEPGGLQSMGSWELDMTWLVATKPPGDLVKLAYSLSRGLSVVA